MSKKEDYTEPRIVLSWSGKESHEVALMLNSWLPRVFPYLNPWISSKDIRSGSKWFNELSSALNTARAAIICVTQSNVGSQWVHYELGAIASKVDSPFVCPYLIGVSPSDLAGSPMAEYQCCESTKDGTLKLVLDLNEMFGNGKIPPHIVEGNFESNWPAIEALLQRMVSPAQRIRILETPPPLSELAAEILVNAAEDGKILVTEDTGGLIVQTNSQEFAEEDPRQQAKAKAAIKQLAKEGLIERVSETVYDVTEEGFDRADELQKQHEG